MKGIPGNPTLADVAARLPDYEALLTPAQLKALTDIDAEIRPFAAAMREMGIEFGTRPDIIEGGFYIPRGPAIREGTAQQILGRRGGRASVRQESKWPTQVEGIQNGERYLSPSQAIEQGLRGAAEDAVDARVANALKEATDDFGEPLGQAIEGATPRGRGQIGLPGLEGTTFPDEMAAAANKWLEAQARASGRGTVAPNVVRAVNQLLRGVRATADVSFMGIQGLLGISHTPTAYMKAWRAAVRSIVDPNVLGEQIIKFDEVAKLAGKPSSQEWIAAGLRVGGVDTEFAIGRGLGSIGDRIAGAPIVSQANRSFGFFGDILRVNAADAMYKPGKAMDEIAENANIMTGWSKGRFLGDMGEMAQFAPRFFQSQLELITNAAVKGGTRGAEARKELIKLIAVGTTTTVLINEALGNDNDYMFPFIKDGELSFDPTGDFNPNFMRIRALDVDFSLFGTWDSLLRGFIGTVKGDPKSFIRSKSSPIIGMAWDAITGRTFTGEPTSIETFLRSLLPFSISDIAREPPAATAIGTTGVKATPVTAFEKFGAEFENQTGEKYNFESPAHQKIINDSPELTRLRNVSRESSASKGFEGAVASQEARATIANGEVTQNVVRVAQSILAGDEAAMANWSSIRGDFLGWKAGVWADAIDEGFEPRTEIGRLTAVYRGLNPKDPKYTDASGNTDWVAYDKDRDKALAAIRRNYPDDAKALAFSDKFIDEDVKEVDRQFQIARQLLDDAPDKYNGLDDEGQQKVNEFFSEVDLLEPQIEELLGKAVQSSNVATALGEFNETPGLLQWYELISSDPESVLNQSYLDHIGRHKPRLEGWFPFLYDSSSDLRRLGLIGEDSLGERPTRPSGPSRPSSRASYIDGIQIAAIKEILPQLIGR